MIGQGGLGKPRQTYADDGLVSRSPKRERGFLLPLPEAGRGSKKREAGEVCPEGSGNPNWHLYRPLRPPLPVS